MSAPDTLSHGPKAAPLVLAGLCGLLGVGLSAAATHSPVGALLDPAARMLIAHAPLFLFLSLARHLAPRGAALAITCAAAVGLVLFAGDLSARAFLGHRLFAFAAPLGGGLLILAWASVALAGLAALMQRKG
ncbi:DUF423 domain-containing protein [Stappia stellulata]|uniref:DUF423 domain-containing protein n=1 Tax=Stappia stellulata TaxID=71235 RepID=UPI000409248C|nr:DUF423 domain-containing protein [Stappia stellulata]